MAREFEENFFVGIAHVISDVAVMNF